MTPTRYRYVVLVFLAAAAAVAYLGRNGMVAAEKAIRGDEKLSEDEMGFLLGPAFFWPYALFQLPLGWIGQRLGPRIWLPALMLITASATAVFGLGGGFVVLLVSRIVSGTAQAGLFPGCTQTISNWYPVRERALATGVLGSFMSVGGAVGMALTGWLQGPVGWETLSYWYAVPGFLWAVGFWFCVRDTPAEHPRVNTAERDHIARERPAMPPASAADGVALVLLLSPALWLICAQQFFRASAYAFFQSWFPTFLENSRGVSTAEAGGLSALPLIGTVLGMLSGGATSDWVYLRTGSLSHARRTLSILAASAAGTTVLAAFFVRDPVAAVLVISCGAFFSGMAGPLAYAVTIDMGGRAVAPVFACMNTAGNVGAGLLPWIVPAFRRTLEANPTLLEVCGGNGWNGVLFLFSALYFLSAFCWLLLRVRGTVLEASFVRRVRRRAWPQPL